MNKDFIAKHWYASVYEQFENQTNDVEFLLKILREQTGGAPQNILEAACGGGRISVPLAQAGHNVTGFDADEYMLMRCYNRMKGLPNITCYQADALTGDWGVGRAGGYDVVVMAGNVLINIETDGDYKEAQQTFIKKAYAALRPGGHLYLDYDQHSDESAVRTFSNLGESFYFKGTDEFGTTGRTIGYGGAYDPVTRIWSGIGHWKLTTNNGEQIIYAEKPRYKHILSLKQVYGWLTDAGFTVEKTFRNFTGEPIADNEPDHVRATIWACRA